MTKYELDTPRYISDGWYVPVLTSGLDMYLKRNGSVEVWTVTEEGYWATRVEAEAARQRYIKGKKDMKKSDLKTGMIVRTGNNKLRMVMGNGLMGINCSGGIPLSRYTEDLIPSICSKDDTVIEIYSEPNDSSTNHIGADISWFSDNITATCFSKLLWKREPEVVEMTVKDIAEKLGIKNLKIIEG